MQLIEEEKRIKYNPDNIFKNNIMESIEKSQEKSLVEIKASKWYEKFWKFLVKCFRK